MKRALKIIIPVVLVVALLAAACWFFLFYNPGLTADLLTGSARTMTAHQRYSRAIRYYELAWKLTPEDPEIPLALADTYAANDNYTKAEYTLVSAISNDPSQPSLYEALCRVYVTQDKLLDAVQMLDRITDTGVRSYLDSARPAAPEITPASGYYTEYIDVTVTSDETLLYVTSDGEYPSNDDDRYQVPISLPAGESTIIALAVNENGLVSPATVAGYTVGGVVEPVTIADPTVEEAVRQLLGLTAADEIMSDALWSITALELPDTVGDLGDLVRFTGLRSLTVREVSGLDLTVLSQLTGLQELDLSGCTISSGALEAIGCLTSLRKLTLNGCALTDISGFSALTKMTDLDLSNNSVSDISVLSLMLELETVDLSNNPLDSIAGLTTCPALASVNITGCGISSIGALSGKEQLTALLASGNKISDLTPLEGCTTLETLVVSNNLVADISVLTTLTGLQSFEANSNAITAIPAFDKEVCVLVRFCANYNEIADLSGLAGITTLNYVELDYNQITDISPLAESYNLIALDVWDNPLEEPDEAVKPFTESSIIVNYNPNYEAPEEEEES